jgi:hypothetical protein
MGNLSTIKAMIKFLENQIDYADGVDEFIVLQLTDANKILSALKEAIKE